MSVSLSGLAITAITSWRRVPASAPVAAVVAHPAALAAGCTTQAGDSRGVSSSVFTAVAGEELRHRHPRLELDSVHRHGWRLGSVRSQRRGRQAHRVGQADVRDESGGLKGINAAVKSHFATLSVTPAAEGEFLDLISRAVQGRWPHGLGGLENQGVSTVTLMALNQAPSCAISGSVKFFAITFMTSF